jgi:hypothetical protein
MVYVLVLSLALALSAVSSVAPRMARGSGLLLGGFLVAFAGLRGNSTDYQEYVLLFDLMQQASDFDWSTRIFIGKDPLFGALMLSIIDLGANVQWLFLIAALGSVGLKLYAFNRALGRTAVPLLVSLCTYFFLHDYTQVRAAIAIALCFVSLIALCEGRFWQSLAFWLLAVGFHASAALFLPLAILAQLRGRRAHLALTIAVALIFATARFAFSELATVDERTAFQLDQTGTSLTPLLINGTRLIALIWLYRSTSSYWKRQRKLMRSCMLLCVVAVGLQIGLRDVSTALAFRMFELFDALSVFILSGSLIRGTVAGRVVSILLLAQQLALNIYAGLLTPYSIGAL